MVLNFCNLNSLWASVMVETLARLGLRSAVICPGSRSTPLTVALARHPQIEAIPILDERSAGFWALGLAKASGLPTVLVCTSGTAGANFYPAVIEARESAVPLLVLTADRPPELRDCHSGQTINQLNLFGDFAQWFSEMATPVATVAMLRYARQTMVQAWRRSQFPQRGVVHLNCPFRDPLAPIFDNSVSFLKEAIAEDFFAEIKPLIPAEFSTDSLPIETWKKYQKGIIIAGVEQPQDPAKYCQAIAQLSAYLNFPVLAEALSPLRNYGHYFTGLISTYDFILRNEHQATALEPEIVVQLGALPTSKVLREWLEKINAKIYILSDRQDNFDPLHRQVIPLAINLNSFEKLDINSLNNKLSDYLNLWQNYQHQTQTQLDKIFLDDLDSLPEQNTFNEASIAYHLSRHLPPHSAIAFANSMTVRYAEFFWCINQKEITPYFNRGANGIDGTLSTAIAIAHAQPSPCVLLTGDLALLHDTNGFLSVPQCRGSLTIIVVNNGGGGIFEMLPIAQVQDVFEEFFVTPQIPKFAKLCAAYDIPYQAIADRESLINAISNLPKQGIRLLEIQGDRQKDIAWLKALLASFKK
jgi:2-succinyl-5-enolpyruvyl-6-hydroxy-3-cyclohexene-1-carboxylate synthase